jgi:hypothetical protein
MRRVGSLWHLLLLQFEVAVLLGPEHEAGRAAAAEARDLARNVRAHVLLERLEERLAERSTPRAPTERRAPALTPESRVVG